MKIVEVFLENGLVVGDDWLARSESVHRQLRPNLPIDYSAKMACVLKDARMALVAEGEAVIGLAVYRWHENTFDGLKFYIETFARERTQQLIYCNETIEVVKFS